MVLRSDFGEKNKTGLIEMKKMDCFRILMKLYDCRMVW